MRPREDTLLKIAGIRVETIAHYLQRYAAESSVRKRAASPPGCP